MQKMIKQFLRVNLKRRRLSVNLGFMTSYWAPLTSTKTRIQGW